MLERKSLGKLPWLNRTLRLKPHAGKKDCHSDNAEKRAVSWVVVFIRWKPDAFVDYDQLLADRY